MNTALVEPTLDLRPFKDARSVSLYPYNRAQIWLNKLIL